MHFVSDLREDNKYLFLVMSDQRMVIVDRGLIEVMDMESQTTLAKLPSSELGNSEKLEYISIELVENESHLIVLTKDQITKVNMYKRDSISISHKWSNCK